MRVVRLSYCALTDQMKVIFQLNRSLTERLQQENESASPHRLMVSPLICGFDESFVVSGVCGTQKTRRGVDQPVIDG
jgi:hypothetical protein